jgi:2-C-methyl-D-erythritol 4-phosphate cytidylyltransferase
MIFAIVVAAGKSDRMGSHVDKAFLSLGTQPVLAYCLQAFEKCAEIDGIILVVRKDRLEPARGLVQIFGCSKVVKVVVGGASRQASVLNGLAVLSDDVKFVSIHDGARPCVTPALISETIKAAKRYGSGVAAMKVTDTVKEVKHGITVARTVDRSMLWAVQTPQTFRRDLLEKGYATARKKGLSMTDDASAVELVSKEVRLVPSTWSNVKVTVPEDLAIVAALLKV